MRSYPGFDLSGKAAIVTGASSGIGTAIAEAMAQAGARVAVVGRDRERLGRCAQGIRDGGGQVHEICVDLTSDEAPERIVSEALEAFGAIDSLVHSAGVFDPQPFLQLPLESLDRQWLVNVRAPYALTKAAVPHMKEGSSIVFISSVAGHVGFPGAAAYCATKGAVELLTRALTAEMAPQGIRVNAIAPGNVHTPMNDHLFESKEYEKAMLERTPAGRIGVVEDIAPVVVFFASDAGRYIHGVSLLVDGGWVA